MAVFDFLKPKWKRSSPQARIEGVKRLKNLNILLYIANMDKEESVRAAASRRMDEIKILKEMEELKAILASCEKSECIHVALARSGLGSSANGEELAEYLKFADLCESLFNKYGDVFEAAFDKSYLQDWNKFLTGRTKFDLFETLPPVSSLNLASGQDMADSAMRMARIKLIKLLAQSEWFAKSSMGGKILEYYHLPHR